MTRKPPRPDPFAEIGQALAIEDSPDGLTLRELSRSDPPTGVPFQVRTWRGDVLILEPGEWREHADPDTGLPPECPVTPLGKVDDTYVFLNTMGAIEAFKASSSGKGPLGSIFAGRSAWLEWAWPRFGKAGKGQAPPVTGWDADDCRQALQDACAYVGPFDDNDVVRGRGAWRDDDGTLIYHAGDRVFHAGKWKPPGRHGRWVFPARPPMPRPWTRPSAGGSEGAAAQLLELFETWNWRRKDIDPHLLLGWTCMAMVAGALDWRPAVYLTGEKGCGKSALQSLMGVVLGKALFKSVNTSGPGIYQRLKHDCTPVWVDELESQPEGSQRKVIEIIELIRTASSGGSINRGSSEGLSREYMCRSPFVCSSINIPPMRGQDQSRFAILQLQPFPALPAGEEPQDLEFDDGEIGQVGRELLRRMIEGWGRWPATLKAFRHALIKAGHEPRGADQFGALLAAQHIAASDDAPTQGELDSWAERLAPSTLAETANKTEDWRECLQHALDVTLETLKHRKGSMSSVGQILASWRKSPNGEGLTDAEDACASVGLALSFPKGAAETWANARLFFPGSHPGVHKLFEKTTWAGVPGTTGVWVSTLARAPDGIAQPGTCAKGLDEKRRGVFIRLAAAFPEPGADGEDGQPRRIDFSAPR